MKKRFLYEVEKYAAEQFLRLAYFCTDQGECSLDKLPVEQMKAFEEVLNRRGDEGWELVQTFFGSDGVISVWKMEQEER
ncbi:MAG: hypothetical protein ACQEQ7_14915 [Thermodesulfobacteriota bacterium]